MGGGATWEPECEQETSFGGKTQITRLKEAQVEGLYRKLSESIGQIPEVFHFNNFEISDGELYYKGKGMTLMIGGKSKVSWCYSRDIRHLKQDDAFNTTWAPVLSIDKCCQVTSL